MAEDRRTVTDNTLRDALAALTGHQADAGSIDRASLGRRDPRAIVEGTGSDAPTPVHRRGPGPRPPAQREDAEIPVKPLEAADRTAVGGAANVPIALDIAAALDDVRDVEGVAITVAGVPGNAKLSAGHDNGDGTWTLNPRHLDGLTLAPATGTTGDMALTVTAETDDATLARLAVTVEAAADAAAPAIGDPTEGGDVVALDVAAALHDLRDTRGLTITVTGVPESAGLTAGTDRGDGTWTLDRGQLDGLGLILPPDADCELVLGVTASDDRARIVARLAITVETVADAASADGEGAAPLRAEKPR